MKSYYGIMKQEYPHTSRPWRLYETVMTSDGPRTRVCDGVWETKEEAEKSLEAREKGWTP